LQLVTAALKKEPNSAELFALRGQCWLKNDDSETARGDFEEALRIDRTSSEAHHGLGMVEEFDGNYEDSVKHFTQALRNDPQNNQYLLDRGRARLYLGITDLARKDFETVLKTARPSFDAVRGLAMCDVVDGNFERGLAGLNSVAAFFRDAEFFYYGGLALKGVGNIEDATIVLARAIEVDHEHLPAYHELGEIYIDAEQYAQAAELILRGLKVSPEDAQCHFLLGLVMLETENPQEAKEYFVRCVKFAEEEEDDDLQEAAEEMVEQLN
jgi:tetratricopeptide (TPR) repeat protein